MATVDTSAPVEVAPPSKVRLGRAPAHARPGQRGRQWRKAGSYLLLSLLSLIVLFPIWSRAFERGDMGRHLMISAVMTVIITGVQLVTSILAAYAFAFLRFPLKNLLFGVFIATLMLPIEVTLIPNTETIRSLGWLNTFQGLTVPFLATAIGTFLIRQGFMGVHKDLRDAARLDGFGNLQFLWRVAIPVTRPVIASFTVISFLAAWNQYLWPRTITTESSMSTVQIILRPLAAAAINELNIGTAAALIAALPILILLIVFQRQLVRGLTAGAVKG
jgi:sn-glycerol 3-phosphate transport system permease protein